MASAAAMAMEVLAFLWLPTRLKSIHSCDFLGYHDGHCPVSNEASPEKVIWLKTLVE